MYVCNLCYHFVVFADARDQLIWRNKGQSDRLHRGAIIWRCDQVSCLASVWIVLFFFFFFFLFF